MAISRQRNEILETCSFRNLTFVIDDALGRHHGIPLPQGAIAHQHRHTAGSLAVAGACTVPNRPISSRHWQIQIVSAPRIQRHQHSRTRDVPRTAPSAHRDWSGQHQKTPFVAQSHVTSRERQPDDGASPSAGIDPIGRSLDHLPDQREGILRGTSRAPRLSTLPALVEQESSFSDPARRTLPSLRDGEDRQKDNYEMCCLSTRTSTAQPRRDSRW
jgi:hypothetical protein